jgi:hypothetical protein
MNNSPLANSISISVRVYRTLLVAYPKKFREHYETHMVQVFRDSLRYEYYRNGVFGVIDLWLHTCVDLFVTALIERISERSQIMFSPKVIMWGGIASAFGGLLWVLTGAADFTIPLALLLTLGGLAAIHARHGKQAGVLGSAGFILGILGTGLFLTDLLWQTITGNSLNPNSSLGLLFGSGLPIVGIGTILIGIRTLQTGILPRSSGMLSFAIGVSQIGFGISGWLAYSTTSDPWHPMTIFASAMLFFIFAIGIFWMVLGAIIAGNPGWQISNDPSASA